MCSSVVNRLSVFILKCFCIGFFGVDVDDVFYIIDNDFVIFYFVCMIGCIDGFDNIIDFFVFV